jgi:hypothetical protein
VAPSADPHTARRPLIVAWRHCLASLATGFASRRLTWLSHASPTASLPGDAGDRLLGAPAYGGNH